MGGFVGGIFIIIDRLIGARGQFKRDAAHIAGEIFEREGGTKVDRFVQLYKEVMEKVYKKDC